jgi:hypothetical protein
VDSVIVLDDIVDIEIQDQIESALLGAETNWRFSRYSAYRPDRSPEVSDSQRNSITAFNHRVFDGHIRNPHYELYCSVVKAVADRLNFKILAVTNLRSNLQLPVSIDIGQGIPHVDKHDPTPYKICVYYVNGADGATRLYKQTTDNSKPEDIQAGLYEELITIEPKRGRAVLFDGNMYHRAGMPTKDIRCILNYNMYIKEKHETK